MRLTPIALSVAIVFGTMASAGHSQRPDAQIDPRSVAFVEQGQALLASNEYNKAIDMFETALVVDPLNRNAYIGIARAAQGQKLPGKALKYYDEALKIQPNDLTALAGQGEALVQRGAVDRAKQTLERIREICKASCPQATTLAAVIAKGPPPQVETAEATTVPPKPQNDN